jgi:hypothetical protein
MFVVERGGDMWKYKKTILAMLILPVLLVQTASPMLTTKAQSPPAGQFSVINAGPSSYPSRWNASSTVRNLGTNNFIFYSNETSFDSTFFVNITVTDVTNLYGWGIGIIYDNTTLQYVTAWLPNDNVFAGAVAAGASVVAPSVIIAPYNATCQEIQWGASYTQSTPSWDFNGTGTLAQVEFQIIGQVNSTITQVSSSLTFDPAWTGVFFWSSGSEVPPLTTGNFVFVWVPASSSTSVVTSSNSAAVGSAVNCTATVTGSNPTGTVTWTTSSNIGSFSSSIGPLSSGSCSTTYVNNDTGYVTIAASYSGDANNGPSSGTATLTVFMNVTTGTNVTVTPTNNLQLTFADVTAAGIVVANETPTAPGPTLDLVGPYYSINVTASFVGNVTVTVTFDGSNMTQQQKSSLTMMQYTPIPGDIAAPYGRLDMGDIICILYAFGSTPGKPNWNPVCDIDGNGKVDMGDVVIALRNFGKTANWTNITLYVDTTNNIIYGQTTHFCFIAIH